MAEGLRIGRISVEGFKGFTEAQAIDIRNRHVFLIGPNGNGKSSIIEAIRWGLFGSTGRPNDVVRNGGYGGDCRVEIDLTRGGKEWRLRRTLNPGGGSSRAGLFDEDGVEHAIRDVLPQMDSLGAGEGTHIIFNPQSAPLRRQPEDLSPFERTVFDHLGLKHPRALLSHLETFAQAQEEEESSLDTLVSNASQRIDSQIAELEVRRGRILASPPWDGDLQPSRRDSERKAQNLISKIAPAESNSDFSRFSLGALVDEAERALRRRIDLARTPLDDELAILNDKLSCAEDVQEAEEHIVLNKEQLTKARESLLELMAGKSMDGLRERADKARLEVGTLHLRHRLGEIAAELLDRTQQQASTPCPICGVDQERDELEDAIFTMVHSEHQEAPPELRAAEDQWNTAQEIESDVQERGRILRELERDLEEEITLEDDDELTAAIEGSGVADYIRSLTGRQASVMEQIDDFDNWHRTVETDLDSLREEADYQQLQRDLSDLRAVEGYMKGVQQAFEHVVEFGESVRDIRDAVSSTLTEELRKKTPGVAEDLTSVFSALTRHPHFDRLIIDEKQLPKLKLGVASSSDSSRTRHPTGVLNGQAQSALELVPYFALSQAAEAPTEVYLVLLDDPTRAFDREHIQILIEQLSDLGERVQVVVATQEIEAFYDLLPRSFKRESYVVIEPKSWSYAEGPDLVAKYD